MVLRARLSGGKIHRTFALEGAEKVGWASGEVLYVQPCSECLPPNPACRFLCTGLSSIIRVALSVNEIVCVALAVLRGDPGDRYDRGPAFFDGGRP